MDSRIYWIWLAQALGVGEASMGDLLAQFDGAAQIYSATAEALLAAGIPKKTVHRLQDKSLVTARAIFNRVVEAGDWVLTPADALYPLNLRRLPDCPAALYCRGTVPDMDVHVTLALVGTRRVSDEGWRAAYSLAAGLAAGGAIVVTGGAIGVDAAANAGAVEGGGITVAVLACPLDENYPAENAALRQRILDAGGLLISEYPHGETFRCVFPLRNRLIAGLSHGVCLGETPVRSGGRITARLAREQGREVVAMPAALAGHANDGAHREIQNGAALITCAADVLEEYAPLFPACLDIEAAKAMQKALDQKPTPSASKKTPRAKTSKTEKTPLSRQAPAVESAACPATASPAAQRVYAGLTDKPQTVDDLAAAMGLTIPILLAALTELEMFGCAANTAGQHYIKL